MLILLKVTLAVTPYADIVIPERFPNGNKGSVREAFEKCYGSVRERRRQNEVIAGEIIPGSFLIWLVNI